jgi:4-hydroxybenzoate polyprenyltransferase
MATPALTALLWSGSIPPFKIILLGLITAFAGYTAVYALNDLVDFRVDRERLEKGLLPEAHDDLDSVFVRHPLAFGFLSFKMALIWAAGWGLLAVVGAYLLNPFCLIIFLAGCLLETIYCLLWQSSTLKIIFSGAVKTSGGLAAVLAVDPNPSLPLLALLFLWLFAWEIGGQNLPNDWADIEEDQKLKATTIPVCYGPGCADGIILSSLILAVLLNIVLMSLSGIGAEFFSIVASLNAGFYLLLLPAYRLHKTKERREAMVLFNRASYYPLVLLLVVIIAIMI